MDTTFLDDEIKAILERYVREVLDDEIRAQWVNASYDSGGLEMRLCVLSAIALTG
jgi:hypothetical protein